MHFVFERDHDSPVLRVCHEIVLRVCHEIGGMTICKTCASDGRNLLMHAVFERDRGTHVLRVCHSV